MWILTVLPDAAIHLILTIGVLGTIAGFVLGFIPLISRYKLPIQIISLLILALGVYLEGGLADNKEWLLKVAEMEKKVAEAEAKSQVVNTQIVEKIVTQKQVIREKGNEVIKYVDKEIVKYDTKYLPGGVCEIPVEVIKAHDSAAKGQGVQNTEVKANTPIPTDEINKAAKGQK
jgi:hypothetical protein